jgi:hypothetical protein
MLISDETDETSVAPRKYQEKSNKKQKRFVLEDCGSRSHLSERVPEDAILMPEGEFDGTHFTADLIVT